MERLIDQGILYVAGLLLLAGTKGWVRPVLAALLALIYIAVSNYAESGRVRLVFSAILTVGCCFLPGLLCFLPLVCYDCVWLFLEHMRFFYIGTAGIVLLAVFALVHGKNSVEPQLEWLVFLLVLAGGGAYRMRRHLHQKKAYIHLKDSSTELRLVMQKRQQELMEKQDYEIYLATLRERNRIAREIHDNVGHMLSRSILQMGALITIHKEEPLHGQLAGVGETLNQAMNSIRESVHDLHDESIDLRQSIAEATREMKEHYQLTVDYDMSPEIPRNVKYCFITAVKEAMSNIAKHSDADKISVILREHPAFYQLTVEDNGTVGRKGQSGLLWEEEVVRMDGKEEIGLSNMKERVQALGGTFRIHTENGFVIFISIPKRDKM